MPDISRRELLRSVSVAGAASVGAAAGVGTHAFLTDGGVFRDNSLASGSLDLQLAARTESDGDESFVPQQSAASFPSAFVEESTVDVEFPSIDPVGGKASGRTTVALRSCDNPGRVWLRAQGADSALADAVDVTVAYAADCEDGGSTIYEGSLSGFVADFADGVRLYRDCTELGKVEFGGSTFEVEETGDKTTVGDVEDGGGTLTFESGDDTVDVDITGLHWKESEDEVRGVDLASGDVGFCRVDVKGGGSPDEGTVTYRPGCASSPTGLVTVDNPGGEESELSNFTVYACGDDRCLDCETTACLDVEWTLQNPKKYAEESVSFDLELYARQCRHTEPTNPWQ